MLNLQFAETMELTEAELEKIYGGDLVYAGTIPGGGGWGGFGTPWSITNFWEKNFNHDSSTVNRRR
ncbi:peptide pheromone VP1 [Streptococcus sp. SPS1]|uniref:peptide pheromone VP1 n=1 Tax=Streptococcus sp. SPS1 TaxID=3018247 RepID=UPI00263E79EE|nr:peptide pheromone VP1 [Streptococcus sp. SPS1]MDN5026238.1 peptide pheromone VP1 [Streptococcus sp. SPS1]